jgi:hypothetical protein
MRLLLTAGGSLAESIGLPAAAYLAAARLDGRDAGLIAGLRQPATHHPGLHRFFQAATWLWAGIFLLLTAGLAVRMVTEPTSLFLMLSTAATIALVVARTAASALWFRSVLRRLALRLRFAHA